MPCACGQVLSSMRFDRKLQVPEGYELAFKQANAIFHHARVYDARARKLSFLKPVPALFLDEFNGDLDFLGPDLPPSRALAIAEGRLDPISMCAFNELACTAPSTTLPVTAAEQPGSLYGTALPFTAAEQPGSVCGSSLSGYAFHKEDVWLGTDEELFATLAVTNAAPLCSPSAAHAALSSAKLLPDNGFAVHLASIASSREVDPPSAEQGKFASDNVILLVSPGKKRVLSPLPNNNPFKRQRSSDEVPRASDMTSTFFDDVTTRQYCSGKHETWKANSSFRVCRDIEGSEAVEASHLRHESYISVDGDARAAMVQEPAAANAISKAGVHNVEPIGSTTNNFDLQKAQNREWSPSHRDFESQPSCDAKVVLDALPRMITDRIQSMVTVVDPSQSINTIAGISRTPIGLNRQQTENKMKKPTRSKSVASSSTSSTPGLLRFFCRAPTL